MNIAQLTRQVFQLLAAIVVFARVATATVPFFAENYGVGAYDTQGRPTEEIFSGSGDDYPRAIAPMPDGGFVVAGQIAFPRLAYHSGAYNSDAVLVRFAADGSVIWQTALHQTNSVVNGGVYNVAQSFIAKMTTDAQGNVFVAGGKGNPSNGGSFVFVAKFSPSGVLLWQSGIPTVHEVYGQPPQTWDPGTSATFVQMAPTLDGGVLVTGDQGRPEVADTTPFLAKFDASGALAFYRVLENPDRYGETPRVAQSADGTKYILAKKYPVAVGNFGAIIQGLQVSVLDAGNGQVLAERRWTPVDMDPSTAGSETLLHFIRTADGGFASLSTRDNGYGVVFRKFNNDASATTVERLIRIANGTPGFFVGSQNQPSDIGSFSQTADSGYLIGASGAYPGTTSGQDAALMKLKADGTLEWISVLGGPDSEGYSSIYQSGVAATQLSDGVYGVVVGSSSYRTDPSGDATRHKPDWWVVRTNTARKIPGFGGTMTDMSPSLFDQSGAPQTPAAVSYYNAAPYGGVYSSTPVTSTAPTFLLQDVGKYPTPDVPSLVIQAASPRIVSGLSAEAYVTRHFAYHVFCAFFPANSILTYSASGLPANFKIDAATGVISGVPAAGTQTTTPIQIALSVTDGIDTATATLQLTIGDGAPIFSVNGNDQPAYPGAGTPITDQVDKVLTFQARQPGFPAGRALIVEASTTPDIAGSWLPLANGTNGFMPLDRTSSKDSPSYVVGTTNYPHVNGVYFRARSKTTDRDDTFSNVVGPFDLASNAQRLGKTNLFVTHNGPVANIRWGVTEETVPAGITVRIQATQTPSVEGSWLNVANGQLRQDTTTPAPNEFYLGMDNYPISERVYFRAVASASGYVDSVSAANGPFTFINDPAATITLTIPGVSGTDGQDFDFPITPSSSSFNVSANASSSQQIVGLDLIYDADTLQHFGGQTGQTFYSTNVAGDHLIEAVAIDKLGVIGDARPVHVRVAPPSPGRILFITSAGNWNDPNIWIDGNGNHAVPGPNDFAVLSNVNVTLTSNVTVRALSMNGATISYTGARPKITVTGWFTVGGGKVLTDVDIGESATLLMINDTDWGLGGLVTNNGRLKMHGKGGITGILAGVNAAGASLEQPDDFLGIGAFFNNAIAFFTRPAGGRAGSAKPTPTPGPTPTPAPSATPVPEVRKIEVSSMVNSVSGKLVAQGAGNLVAQGAGNLVAQGAGNLVAQGAGNLVAQGGGNAVAKTPSGLVDKNGNPLVAQGGGNLVAQGGGNLVAQGGGNLVAQGGGNIISTGGGGIIGPDGASIVAQGAGNLINQDAASFVPRAASGGSAEHTYLPAVDGTFTVEGGQVDLGGISIIGPVQVNGGIVSGNGVVVGDLTNNGGVIAPGNSSGVLGVSGSFSQGPSGTLLIRATGGEASQFDRVESGSTANLGGNLKVYTFNNYTPLSDDPFAPLAYNGATGNFASVSSNAAVTVTPNGVVSALPAAQVPPPPLQVTAIKSRKVHGTSGTFDVNMNLDGSGVEPRSGGATGDYALVFTLNNPLASVNGAAVASGPGSITNGALGANPQEYVVNLTGVTNAQSVGVQVNNLKDTFDQTNGGVTGTLRVLVGDVNSDGNVNSGDATAVRNRSGQPTDAVNFRTDVNADGTVNSGDLTIVRSRSGSSLGAEPAASVRKDAP